ncbi:hypothetical protein KCP69_00810 [Salmonella enterica subsp. enterica]|nr:hypothetical protein KCP69_00810 [Salmonella enterica subsp. enterica]
MLQDGTLPAWRFGAAVKRPSTLGKSFPILSKDHGMMAARNRAPSREYLRDTYATVSDAFDLRVRRETTIDSGCIALKFGCMPAAID